DRLTVSRSDRAIFGKRGSPERCFVSVATVLVDEIAAAWCHLLSYRAGIGQLTFVVSLSSPNLVG
ncbi:MAG: hypothetical protein NXI22_13670, partial [bacterium]|nr:hypothetical protein [bacterium]